MKEISPKQARDGGECRDGGVLLLKRLGRGFFYLRLEAHLNSGCVSPALAECYLL